jgi:hypothetical protein
MYLLLEDYGEKSFRGSFVYSLTLPGIYFFKCAVCFSQYKSDSLGELMSVQKAECLFQHCKHLKIKLGKTCQYGIGYNGE